MSSAGCLAVRAACPAPRLAAEPRSSLTTPALALRRRSPSDHPRSYPLEEHTVTTSDGYILQARPAAAHAWGLRRSAADPLLRVAGNSVSPGLLHACKAPNNLYDTTLPFNLPPCRCTASLGRALATLSSSSMACWTPAWDGASPSAAGNWWLEANAGHH